MIKKKKKLKTSKNNIEKLHTYYSFESYHRFDMRGVPII